MEPPSQAIYLLTSLPRPMQKKVISPPQDDKLQKAEQNRRTEAQRQTLSESMTRTITMAELKKTTRTLTKKKSPGPDGMTNEMLIHLGNTARSKLLQTLNLSWSEGKVPQRQ